MNNFFIFKKNSIKSKFFIMFFIMSLVFGVLIYNLLYKTYHNATVIQVENICDNYKTAVRSVLSSFINEIHSFTKVVNNDTELISILEECYSSEAPITDEMQIEIENILKKHIKSNNSITSLRLYVDNEFGNYQTKNFYATDSSSKVISEDYMGRSKWYNKAYAGEGKLFFRPTYKKLFSLPEVLIDDKVYDYSENIMSFFKVLKNSYGKQLAVISVDIDETTFYNMLQNISLPYNTKSYIIDPDGTVITSNNRSTIGKNFYAELPFVPKSEMTPFNRIVSANVIDEYIYRQDTFYYEDWKIITMTPMKNLFIDMNMFNKLITSFLIYFIIIGLLISLVMTRLFSQPINNLIQSINAVKSGDLSSRIDTSKTKYIEVVEVQTSFNEMLDSLQRLLKENYEIRIREKEAQIKSLEAQINPHFLYNTLDTINWKVYMLGGEDISKLITSLSKILRYSISNKIKIVTLQEEIDQIKNYLFIQETRYEGRIKVYFNLDEDTLNLKVHKFLLQPLVENAIVHGLENKEKDGVIRISSYTSDNKLIVEIYDNGEGISQQKIKKIFEQDSEMHSNLNAGMKNHIGINNVHNRLQFYYGPEYCVKIESVEHKYTKIFVQFPICHDGEEF